MFENFGVVVGGVDSCYDFGGMVKVFYRVFRISFGSIFSIFKEVVICRWLVKVDGGWLFGRWGFSVVFCGLGIWFGC